MKQHQGDKLKRVMVSAFWNDGEKGTRQSEPSEKCYRELTGSHLHFSKIQIEYEKPILSVAVYDHESEQFVHCFSQLVELDYNGFFVISASSGTSAPQYNYVNSFELYDPIEIDTSHHLQDSHARKAAHDSMF